MTLRQIYRNMVAMQLHKTGYLSTPALAKSILGPEFDVTLELMRLRDAHPDCAIVVRGEDIDRLYACSDRYSWSRWFSPFHLPTPRPTCIVLQPIANSDPSSPYYIGRLMGRDWFGFDA